LCDSIASLYSRLFHNRFNKNDINSSSGNPQLSGTIQINTEQLDPARERTKTPENVVEPDETVAQACDSGVDVADRNTFTITGRGGMPTDPTQPLSSSYLSGIPESQTQRSREAEEQRGRDAEMQRCRDAFDLDENKKTFSSDEVIPARGIAVNEKGQIVLTAYPTSNAGDRSAPQSNYCTGESPFAPTSVAEEELLATKTTGDRPQETLNPALAEEMINFLYSLRSGQ
jgi:large exoprotein involved in heme utilization and adhesion